VDRRPQPAGLSRRGWGFGHAASGWFGNRHRLTDLLPHARRGAPGPAAEGFGRPARLGPPGRSIFAQLKPGSHVDAERGARRLRRILGVDRLLLYPQPASKFQAGKEPTGSFERHAEPALLTQSTSKGSPAKSFLKAFDIPVVQTSAD